MMHGDSNQSRSAHPVSGGLGLTRVVRGISDQSHAVVDSLIVDGRKSRAQVVLVRRSYTHLVSVSLL